MISSPSDPPTAVAATTVTETVLGERCWGPRAALVDAGSGRVLSYDELTAAVTAAAWGLVRQGPGTVIGLQAPDGPDFVVAAYAVWAAGAVLVPVRAAAGAEETVRRLRASGAHALITCPQAAPRAWAVARGAALQRVWCLGEADGGTGLEPFARLAEEPAADRIPPVRDAGAALLADAPGGSGPGTWLTHRQVIEGLVRFATAGALSGSDVVLSGIPFTDVLGLNGVLGPALWLGATVVTCRGGLHDLLRAVQDHRVTVAVLPPAAASALAAKAAVGHYDLGSLRSVLVAGPLPGRLARACSRRLGCPVRQVYGHPAASGFTHLNLRGAEEGTLDSAGCGLPGVSWRIADPATGRARPPYQPGELWLRGPMVAAPGGGWLPTGDAAFTDEHDRVYILGRMEETPGEPVADPGRLLAAHPAVRDAAVVPVPDPHLGLAPHAFVVLGKPEQAGGLLPYVNGHVPSYQRIQAVHPVDAIPRSPSGRVMRRALLQSVHLSP